MVKKQLQVLCLPLEQAKYDIPIYFSETSHHFSVQFHANSSS